MSSSSAARQGDGKWHGAGNRSRRAAGGDISEKRSPPFSNEKSMHRGGRKRKRAPPYCARSSSLGRSNDTRDPNPPTRLPHLAISIARLPPVCRLPPPSPARERRAPSDRLFTWALPSWGFFLSFFLSFLCLSFSLCCYHHRHHPCSRGAASSAPPAPPRRSGAPPTRRAPSSRCECFRTRP